MYMVAKVIADLSPDEFDKFRLWLNQCGTPFLDIVKLEEYRQNLIYDLFLCATVPGYFDKYALSAESAVLRSPASPPACPPSSPSPRT